MNEIDELVTFAAFKREADARTQGYLAELAAWRDIGAAIQRLEAKRPGVSAELEAERQAIVAARASASAAADAVADPNAPEPTAAPAPAAAARSTRTRRRR